MSFVIENGVLKKYEFDDGVTDVVIPDGVKEIGEKAFYKCSGLTSIMIPGSVTEIGEKAFYQCWALTSITIPAGVAEIRESTFAWCSGLTSITIPDSVTKIGVRAFKECRGLTSITIPDSVTEIGEGAFRESGLTSITIPTGVRVIGKNAFAGSELTSIAIPDSVTEIGEGAFYGCSSMTSITIPDGMTKIWVRAFKGLCGLTSITIPESVTEIGEGAFEGCSGLTSITIPDSVTEIGDRAFCWCPSVTSVKISNGAKKIGEDAFWGLGYDHVKGGGKVICTLPPRLKGHLKGTGLDNKSIVKTFIAKAAKQKKNIELKMNVETIKKWIKNQPRIPAMPKWLTEREISKGSKRLYGQADIAKLKLANGEPAPIEALWFIISRYSKAIDNIPKVTKTNYKTAIGTAAFVPEADQLAEMLDKKSLCAALASLGIYEQYYIDIEMDDYISQMDHGPFEINCPIEINNGELIIEVEGSGCSEVWPIIAPALCRYGDEAMIHIVCQWINHYFNDYGAEGRKLIAAGRTALLLSDTKRAAQYLDTCKALGIYAAMRGKKESDYRDKLLSNPGFDASGEMEL